MSVEPPHNEVFSIEQTEVTPRKDEYLRRDLWFVLGGSLDDVDEWIAKHGRVNAEEKIRSYWL